MIPLTGLFTISVVTSMCKSHDPTAAQKTADPLPRWSQGIQGRIQGGLAGHIMIYPAW